MAKVFLRTYLRHILSLYDLLNGGGVGGGNILKKSVYWRYASGHWNFEHS
jgi:hypothetical protein